MVATTIAPLALPPTAAPTAATNATSDRTNTCAPRAPTRHTRASGNVWRRWEAGLRWHTTHIHATTTTNTHTNTIATNTQRLNYYQA